MTFDVTIDDRQRRVSVEAGAVRGRFRLDVDGRSRSVDAAWIDAKTLSLIDADVPARVYDVGIETPCAGELEIAVGGRRFLAAVAAQGNAGRRRLGTGRAAAAPGGRQAVVALLPGRIVRVLVAPGDRVAARQPVVIVEAMKMENELRAPKDGVVRDVHAAEGAAVDAGAALVVIE